MLIISLTSYQSKYLYIHFKHCLPITKIHLFTNFASSANVRTFCKNGDFAFAKPPLLVGEFFPKPLTKIGEKI